MILVYFVCSWMKFGSLEWCVVIVGGGMVVQELIYDFEVQLDNDICICGIFDDWFNDCLLLVVVGYLKLGNICVLVEFVCFVWIDMFIVCILLCVEQCVLELFKEFWVLFVDICFLVYIDKVWFWDCGMLFIGVVLFVDVVEKLIVDWDMVVKWVFDLFFVSFVIVCLFLFMIVVVIVIKLDSKGFVLFWQKCYGFNNEIILVLKFCFMYVEMVDLDVKKVVIKGDLCVIWVGCFIWKMLIDELLQLFNVLVGSLFFVGFCFYVVNVYMDDKIWDDVVDGYFVCYKVKFGVIGWV